MKRTILCLLFLAAAASASAQAPAARVTDQTSHGGHIIGPGVPTVLIAGLAALLLIALYFAFKYLGANGALSSC